MLGWVNVPGWIANTSDHMILEEGGYVLLIWGYHQVYLVYCLFHCGYSTNVCSIEYRGFQRLRLDYVSSSLTFAPYICMLLVLFAMTSVCSRQNSVSLGPALFCTSIPNFPVTPVISWLPTFAFQSHMMNRTSFWGVISRRSCRSSLSHSTSASSALLVGA